MAAVSAQRAALVEVDQVVAVPRDQFLDLFMAEKEMKILRDAVSLLVREEEIMADVIADLRVRVVDWKSHRLEYFGKLLLHSGATISILNPKPVRYGID